MPAYAGTTDQRTQARGKPVKIAGDEKNLPLKEDWGEGDQVLFSFFAQTLCDTYTFLS